MSDPSRSHSTTPGHTAVGRAPEPPVAPRRPVVLRRAFTDGRVDERIDEWYWLRDRDDPAVRTYLEAENAYTEAVLAHLGPLRERLFEEIKGRVRETDASAPVRKGPFEYFVRTRAGWQYGVHCRRPAGTAELPDPEAPPGTPPGEQVVLDENALAGTSAYFALGGFALSPDQRRLAYSTDHTGGERYTLHIHDLVTGRPLGDEVPDTYYGLAWSTDGRCVFFTRPDDAMRPYQVWCHRLGTPSSADRLVFEEPDERYFVSVESSRTERLVVITSASKLTTEVWLLPADAVGDDPAANLHLVAPRDEGVEYHVEHHVSARHGDRLFVLTNADGAENFQVMVASTASPGRAEWEPFIPHRSDVRLDDVDAFAHHLVLSERREGLARLRVHRLSDGEEHELEMPDAVYAAWVSANPEFDVTRFRFEYSSLVTPPSTYEYDLDGRTRSLVKRQDVAGYEPTRYAASREWAIADDGTRIPISVVVPRDRAGGRPGPLLLYGYGSYEISVDPTFSASRLSLLERGFGFAIAHVRGGGEMGRHWYEDGKLDRKHHTFGDFVACARHLVDRGLTRPELLVARGGSAGGLLMGVVANTAPELFRAIVAEVPFVDCLTTILDASLPLTVTEWEEWGNPVTDDHIYEYLRAYSPYDNVRAGPYPAMLVTGGMNDPRVQYWEPAKWVAKLRSRKTDDHVLVLKMEMDAGHSGPSGRYDAWRDEAFVLAFILDQVGITR